MNDNKTKWLIGYLASLGFEGEAFQRMLYTALNIGEKRFTLPFSTYKEDQKMSFSLTFVYDHQFSAFRLEKYEATLKPQVVIKSFKDIGISSKELDEKMKTIDWDIHFSLKNKEQKENQSDPLIAGILSDLSKFRNPKNEKGLSIADLLEFKHWPYNIYRINHKVPPGGYIAPEPKEFYNTEAGICNIHAAYYLMSGDTERAHELVESTGISTLTGQDCFEWIDEYLSRNQTDFEIAASYYNDNGRYRFFAPLHKDDEGFRMHYYTVRVLPLPKIKHGIFNGVDTVLLEKSMQRINWSHSARYYSEKWLYDKRFHNEVDRIKDMLDVLCNDAAGSPTGDLLQIKYWAGTPGFVRDLSVSAVALYQSLHEDYFDFQIEIQADIAVNLIEERPVMARYIPGLNVPENTWVRLDSKMIADGSEYPYVSVGQFSGQSVEEQLQFLPVQLSQREIYRLTKGELIEAELTTGIRIKIAVSNPEERILSIYDAQGVPIPFNFRLATDWQPPDIKQLPRRHNHDRLPPDDTLQGKKL